MPDEVEAGVLIAAIAGEVVLPGFEIPGGSGAGGTDLAVRLVDDAGEGGGTEDDVPVGVLVGVVVGGIDSAADEVVDVTLAPGELAVGGGADLAAGFEALFDRLPPGRVVEVTGLAQRAGDVLLADDEPLGAATT